MAIIDKETDDFILHKKNNHNTRVNNKLIKHTYSDYKVKNKNKDIFWEVDKNIVEEDWDTLVGWANKNHIQGIEPKLDESGDPIPDTYQNPHDSVYIVTNGKWLFSRQYLIDDIEETEKFLIRQYNKHVRTKR